MLQKLTEFREELLLQVVMNSESDSETEIQEDNIETQLSSVKD